VVDRRECLLVFRLEKIGRGLWKMINFLNMIQTREDWKRVMENDKFFEYDCDGRVR